MPAFFTTRRRASLAASSSMLAMLSLWAGCTSTASSPTDEPGTEAAQPAIPFDHDAWSTLGYRLDWQGFPFAGTVATPHVTFLTPSENYVLVQEKSGPVSLLETSNGARRWTSQPGTPHTKFLGVNPDPSDPQRLFVSAEAELFVLAAANGNITAREKFGSVVQTAPAFIDGVVVYGSASGDVVAHRPGGAVLAWSFGTNSPIYANPVRMTDTVGALTHDGRIYIFNGQGALMGQAHILDKASTNPITDGTHIAIAGRDQSLWCFDAQGNQIWRLRQSQPLTVQPTTVGSNVLCDLPDHGLSAIDYTTGNILWSNPKAHGTILASNKGRLLLWDGTTASIIDAARGDILASTTLPGITQITTDQFDGGNLYAATSQGAIAKLKIKN